MHAPTGLLFTLLLALLGNPVLAQAWKKYLRVDARVGRLSYGHGDVVRENEQDKGNLFDGLDLGASASLFRTIHKHWTFHSELGLSHARQRFQLPCNCPQTQDRVIVLENDLSWTAFESMGSSGYSTANENYWHALIGLGWSLPLQAKRAVDYRIDFLDSRPDSSGTIEPEGQYKLRTGGGYYLGFLWEASLGHYFANPALPIWAEAYYRADLTAWTYEIDYAQDLHQEVTLKRASFGLRVSFGIGGAPPAPRGF